MRATWSFQAAVGSRRRMDASSAFHLPNIPTTTILGVFSVCFLDKKKMRGGGNEVYSLTSKTMAIKEN